MTPIPSMIACLLIFSPFAAFADGYFVDASDLVPWMHDFQRISERRGDVSEERHYAKYIGYLAAVHDDTRKWDCDNSIQNLAQLGAIIARALLQRNARMDIPADEFITSALEKAYPCHGGSFYSGNKLVTDMREYQKYRRGERFDLASANIFLYFSLGIHDRLKHALCPSTKTLSESTVADMVAGAIEATPEKWNLPAYLTASVALMDGLGCAKNIK